MDKKTIFWLIVRLVGFSTIMIVIFVLFLISGAITAISRIEIPSLTAVHHDCTDEDECKIENSKPSGNPAKGACITATFYDPRPWGFHGAVDFAGGSKKIVATHDGVAIMEMFSGGSCTLGGKTYRYDPYPNIKIVNDEYTTEYLHMIDIKVKNGDFVKKGDQIGTMGNRGCSTGTHLHYEVHKKINGVLQKENPEQGYVATPHCN